MRIGELAALAGVTTRTVRHYHHQGLLPEPHRLANGYRHYQLRDAVTLARIRRLTELGLALDEIRDVIADDHGSELREVLLELDADLARRQQAITAQRDQLATLLARTHLHLDSTAPPDITEILHALPTTGSTFAETDRALLAMLGSAPDPAHRTALADLLRPLTTPEAHARGHALNLRLDELADADPTDPRIPALARDLADHLPDDMITVMITSLDDPDNHHWLDELTRELPAAQAETFRLMTTLLKERK
ncbi:MerR family transcriptional regulator [Actinomadura craniellae]|uniref:MerR family transcriptional regulator n=1 Tax=Actinomadura craniellae TaxID=2231787 RepID=A0A365H4I6_9ACTN|nr:MerR family transcriptional regulator [Actinomadura craniellae]RAY14020.1 MerR family transcriptional regulator [Actinomadura craniellae]